MPEFGCHNCINSTLKVTQVACGKNCINQYPDKPTLWEKDIRNAFVMNREDLKKYVEQVQEFVDKHLTPNFSERMKIILRRFSGENIPLNPNVRPMSGHFRGICIGCRFEKQEYTKKPCNECLVSATEFIYDPKARDKT